MPLQNRVGPDGAIFADEARGLFMGNRGGRIHDADRQLGTRRWVGKAWICCVTSFKGRLRKVMGAGYTELFFLDEATALAAGHRPCFECRRVDAVRFAELWQLSRGKDGRARAHDMDAALHAERLDAGGGKRTYFADASDLPDGAMIAHRRRDYLVLQGRLYPWTAAGYLAQAVLDSGTRVSVLTPPSIVAVLSAGYRVVVHPSAVAHRDEVDRRTGKQG